jgi:phospholipid/cholesterol/gamma-HCH transport system substrate-binding protein
VKTGKIIYIALLFLVAIALLIWGLNFMKGRNILTKERTLYAVYDRIAGLNVNNPILINGHQVGLVRYIEFAKNDPDAKLIVQMGITSKIPIPEDSRAIIETNLLGSNVINIQLGKSSLMAGYNDTLSSDVATTLQEQFSLEMLPVKKKAENLMLSLDTILTIISTVLNEETRLNLSMAMENIRRSIDNLKNTTYNIDTLVSSQKNRLTQIFSNVESITTNLEDNNQAITNIIDNFSAVSDTLAKVQFAQTIRNADHAISEFSSVMTKVNEGDGTLSLLINDKKLYKDLEKSSEALNELIRDMKQNPDRYIHLSVFGKSSRKVSKEKK